MGVRARTVALRAAVGAVVLAAVAAPAATATPQVERTPLPPASALAAASAPASAAASVPASAQPAARAWAPAATAALHPGVTTVTAGGGMCTTNFVFTSGDRVFLGQAAHCAGTGADTEVDGCRSGTGPVGSPVTIEASDGTRRAATLAYSSWVTMQAMRETDPARCAYNDFALVELAPADIADVNPSIPFFGGPGGIDTDGLAPGDEVFTYGTSSTDGVPVLRPKAGVGAADLGGGRGHEVYPNSPAGAGDSGSAFLTGTGDAVGILSTRNLTPLPESNGVSDIAHAMAYANANGALGELQLVLGTEPFTATPAGVPLTEVAPPAGPPIED